MWRVSGFVRRVLQWRDVFQRHLEIGVILFLFCGLGLVWSVIVPVFETPDEVWHYAYVKNVADGHGLPVQKPFLKGLYGGPGRPPLRNPDIEQPWRQEGSQPPLHYLTAALLTFWIDSDNFTEMVWWNPFSEAHRPGQKNDNQNLFIHTKEEGFPYHGAALAMHITRLLSVAMGAVTVLATYLIAREIFPQRREVAIGAAAINAFNPQFTFISGSASNDAMVTGICSVALLLMVRMVYRGASDRRVAVLGLVIGLALITKVSALALLPLALIVVAVVGWRQRSWASFFKWCLLLMVIVVLLAGWWYARNLVLYGEVFGTRTLLLAAGYSHRMSLGEVLVAENFRELGISFWAAFGWGNIRVHPLIYQALCLVMLLAGVGLVVGLVRGLRVRRLDISRGLSIAILSLWVVIVFAALVTYMQVTFASVGRLLFPAISSISILLWLGLMELVPRRFSQRVSQVFCGLMVCFNVGMLLSYVVPAYYTRPAVVPAVVAETLPDQVRARYDDKVELVAYELGSGVVRTGERLAITLYWRALTDVEENLNIFMRVLGRGGQLIGWKESYPGSGWYLTSEWREGEVIKDTYWVYISPQATAPTAAWIQVGLFDLETMKEVPAYDPGGHAVIPVLGPVKIAPSSPVEAEPQNSMEIDLGQKITLIGYDLDGTIVQPGDDIHLTLYWRAQGSIGQDYTVFTHLIDGSGQIWAQKDNPPLGGDYPTSLWGAGEIVRDEYLLVVDPKAPTGEYRLEVGMYEAASGARLPVSNASGGSLGDRVLLDSMIEVVAQEDQ